MPRVAAFCFPARSGVGAALLLSATLGAPLMAQPPASQPPTAAAAAPTTATTATTASTATTRPRRESWTSDRRDFAVGDLITVLIDDYTIATALKENTATDARSRGLSLNAQLPSSSKNVGLDTKNSADQQQRGSSRRENRFQNELSVRVVAVGPNGLLQLKGTKNIDVDKSGQNIVFTGWVRPQDVSMTNIVESNRIADAQLGYVSPGPLGKPSQGIISKILGGLWP
jgi:flagellar L-ring protein precursor FlgH